MVSIENPGFRWIEQAEQTPDAIIELENNKKITISYDDEQLKTNNIGEIKNQLEKFIKTGYEYIEKASGNQIKLSTQFNIDLEKRSRHGAHGALIKIASDRILATINNPQNQNLYEVEQSLITHELMHNITDDEDLTMFIEIIYLIEHHQGQRLQDILDLYQENIFENKYIKGLEQITNWLNFNDIQTMLKNIKLLDIEYLKKIFTEQTAKYLKEIDEETKQAAQNDVFNSIKF